MIAVGKLKADFARAGCADFFDRAGRYLDVEVVEVRDARRSKRGDPAQYKADEAERLLAAIPPGATVLALDERGRQWDSRGFAGYVAELRDRATPCLALVIGGPDGLDPAVRTRADRVWALGQLTMSHELARLVLAEQLYRAGTIMAGLPYHRD